MSQQSGFFESIWDETIVNPQTGTLGDWDIKYYYNQFADYFAKFFGNGVYYNPDDNLKVLSTGGMSVAIKAGWAFINGFWFHLDEDISLPVPGNTTAYTRTDSVILRWNLSDRVISLIYATDTTEPTRSDSIYDLILANIVVEPSVASILGDKITDKRVDQNVCGIVRGLQADSIDTETLFAQYDAIFNEWFDTVKDQVTGDLAIRLQLEFDELNQTVEDYQESVEQTANSALDTITTFVANYFVLPLQTLTFTNRRCEIADSRVTADSLVDVYFTADTMDNAESANIYVDSAAGKIILTCTLDPIGTIQARIGVRN
jgi:hypothetical protein